MTFDSRFDEFSFHALSLICEFSSSTPQEAVLSFGPVCKRWREVMTTNCPSMWSKFFDEKFRNSREVKTKGMLGNIFLYRNGTQQSYNDFVKFASRFALRRSRDFYRSVGNSNDRGDDYYNDALGGDHLDGKPQQKPSIHRPLFEIENCNFGLGEEEENQEQDDQVSFTFTCPVLAENLTRLKETTAEGLPILYCSICQRNVLTISAGNPEQLKEAATKKLCVRIDEFNKNMLVSQGTLASPDKVNVGFIVFNTDQSEMIYEMFRRIHKSGELKSYSAGDRSIPSYAFISRNMVEFHNYVTRPSIWCMRIVMMPTVPTTAEADPFSKENAPQPGGWNFLVALPGCDLKTFREKTNNTMLKTLEETNRIFYYNPHDPKFVGRHGSPQSAEDFSVSVAKELLPEEKLDFFWSHLEKEIINEVYMPKGRMGEVANIRRVRLNGKTRSQDDGNSDDDGEGGKKKSGLCSQQ